MGQTRMVRVALVISAGLALTAAYLWASVSLARAEHAGDHEQVFVDLMNEARVGNGLATLVVEPSMTEAARDWAYAMMDDDLLAHATDITGGAPDGWMKVGENVGRGESASGLFEAFMNSPGHRQNILTPEFSHVGVGVYVSEVGVMYTTHRFALAPIVSSPADTSVSAHATLRQSCEQSQSSTNPQGSSNPQGRIELEVTNPTTIDGDLVARFVGHEMQQRSLDAGESVTIEHSAANGRIDVVVDFAGITFFDEVVTIDCGGVDPADVAIDVACVDGRALHDVAIRNASSRPEHYDVSLLGMTADSAVNRPVSVDAGSVASVRLEGESGPALITVDDGTAVREFETMGDC